MFLSTHYSLLYIYLYIVNVFKYLFLLSENKNKESYYHYTVFYKKNFYKKMSLKNLKKC